MLCYEGQSFSYRTNDEACRSSSKYALRENFVFVSVSRVPMEKIVLSGVYKNPDDIRVCT